MKSCFHCGETLASVASRCTKCGVWIDETVSEIQRSVDQPLGQPMTQLRLASVIVVTLIVLALAVGWMLR